MGTKRRTEITIETDRLIVLSRGKNSVTSWCRYCNRRVRMITVDEAATLAGVSSRTVYRWADDEKLHFTETSEGHLLICHESIAAAGSIGFARVQP